MKRFIAPIFFMLVSSGIVVMYILPTYNAIQILDAKRDSLDNSIVDAGRAKEKIDRLTATEASFPPDYVVRLRTLLPDTVDATRLIIDVNAMAVRDGLHIPTPVISTAQNSGKGALAYVKHTITFSVKAPYTVFKSYLLDLESSLSLRDMEGISFSSQESDEEAAIYGDPALVPHAYNLTLVTYSLH